MPLNVVALRRGSLLAVAWSGGFGNPSWRKDLAQHRKHRIAGALVNLS